MRKLVSFLHHVVVKFVELQPSERLWTAYGDRFEHQGLTFWDWAYYRAENADRRVRALSCDSCKNRIMHTSSDCGGRI